MATVSTAGFIGIVGTVNNTVAVLEGTDAVAGRAAELITSARLIR